MSNIVENHAQLFSDINDVLARHGVEEKLIHMMIGKDATEEVHKAIAEAMAMVFTDASQKKDVDILYCGICCGPIFCRECCIAIQ